MDAFSLLLQRNRQRYPEGVAIRIKKIEDSRHYRVCVNVDQGFCYYRYIYLMYPIYKTQTLSDFGHICCCIVQYNWLFFVWGNFNYFRVLNIYC